MKKIIIIDDHQLLREGINSWVSGNSDWQVLAKLGNLEEVKTFIESYKPSQTDCVVAIVDLSFKVSGVNTEKLYGFEILKMFKNPELNIKTLVYSSHESGGIIAHSLSKEIGACGYVSKNSDCDTILCALEAIAKGDKFIQQNLITSYINAQTKLNMLTKREKEILNCVFAKYTNDEIAENMNISKRSVENYLSRIYDKTGTNNKQQLLEYIEMN